MIDKDVLTVTSPLLPDLDEFHELLKEIWGSKWITNNGQFHQQLEKALCEYLGVEFLSLFTNGTLPLITALQALHITGEVININGGTRDNAIPRDSKAEILFKSRVRRGDVVEEVDAFIADIEKEYSVTDPDIRISTVWSSRDKEEPRIVFTRKDSRRMIRFLLTLPNGVIEYSPLYRDVPQTSLSLGIVKTMADGIRTHSLVRSSVNSQKQMIMDRIECLAEEFGASVNTEGAYPAWELIEKSDFRNLAADVYRKVTGKDAKVCVTHGGLECGLLAAKVKGLDCISIGPDMEEIHTPAERLNIPSTKRMYTYIRELLAACCEAE